MKNCVKQNSDFSPTHKNYGYALVLSHQIYPSLSRTETKRELRIYPGTETSKIKSDFVRFDQPNRFFGVAEKSKDSTKHSSSLAPTHSQIKRY